MRSYPPRSIAGAALGLAALLLASVAAQAGTVISGPTLTMDPNNRTPLAGVVELETDVAVGARLTIASQGEFRIVNFPAATVHSLPVLGLKPDRTYTVDVELVPGGPVGSLLATTGPLPEDFPAVEALVSIPEMMEPGYTFLNCLGRGQDPRPRYSVIVDKTGEVVWYATLCLNGVRQLPNGKIQHRQGGAVREWDMLGGFTELPLDVQGLGLHHELRRTPHGTYLSLDRESTEVPNFPADYDDPEQTATTLLWDDVVAEYLPDGSVRREWPLAEMIDVSRIGYGSLNNQGPEIGVDWTHSNAVNYNLADDSIIVSVRHQDCVIKFSRETGELQWILGPHDNWSPEFQPLLLHPIGTPFRWQFHEHAPMWTADGTLVLFDNGNFRASPFDGTTPLEDAQNFSRGVEYEINEQAMTVRQVWEYGENVPDRVYAGFLGDADWLETTGNVMMTFGPASFVGGAASEDLGLGILHARIIEATDDVVPVKVFELIAYDPAGGRISSYRAERIPDLYPQEYIKAPNGVGDTLRGTKVAGQPRLMWKVPMVDAEHDAAGHYRIYNSSSADGGFTMFESTAFTEVDAEGAGIFYQVVAANVAGTSGDEPAP